MEVLTMIWTVFVSGVFFTLGGLLITWFVYSIIWRFKLGPTFNKRKNEKKDIKSTPKNNWLGWSIVGVLAALAIFGPGDEWDE